MAARASNSVENSRRRTRRGEDSRRGLFGFLVGLAVVLIVVLSALWIKSKRDLVRFEEGGTLCPEPKEGRAQIPELLVILLDSSDELGEAQQLQVSHELDRWRSALPKFGRLDVYRNSSSSRELVEPVLTICNPGDGSDLDGITSNPDLAKKRWRTEFDAKVRKVLRESVAGPPTSVSPILETIQAAAVRTFDLPALDQVSKRRLVVVSDLLQNTAKQSHYRGVPDFEDFRASSYYDEVHATLSGVEVQILYLSRASASSIQGRSHIVFWDKYFESLGATVVEVRKVSGQAPAVPRRSKG